MTEAFTPLRVAAMGDLHIREDNAESYRELFGEVSREADVLALTGDLTDLGRVREAELLAQDLKACSIPVVGVLGNHDYESGEQEEVKRILRDAGMHSSMASPSRSAAWASSASKALPAGSGDACSALSGSLPSSSSSRRS